MLVIHEALYFGDRLKESLLCPNQIRAAGNLVQDTPKQFNPHSTHSITVPDKVDLPLDMHGVISHLCTRKPTPDEVQQYTNGLFQAAVLTEDIPWEPYSSKFASAETTTRTARAAVKTHNSGFVCVEPGMLSVHGFHGSLTEEAMQKTPILTQHCVAVASRLSQGQDAVELTHEDDLAVRLIAALNIEADAKSGDGLYERPDDSLCEVLDAD